MQTIVYEIIRHSLYAIAREMKVAMMRTAASPIMHLGADASAAVFDAHMQLVAQGNDIPTMLGSAVISTKVSVESIGRENLRPGDVIIGNDAYLGGGNHQPDVQITRPIFVDDEIVAFVMTRGHWTDIGGQAPGSYMLNTWDIFGEGIRIPPVLRASVGGEKELSADGSNVGEILRAMAESHPETQNQLFSADGGLNRYVNVYLNDEDVRFLDGIDTALSDGDVVTVLPAVAGG